MQFAVWAFPRRQPKIIAFSQKCNNKIKASACNTSSTVQYLTEFSNVFCTSSERIVQTFSFERPQSVAEQTSVSSFLVPQWHKKKTIAPIVVTNDSKISFWAKTESQKWHFYDRRPYRCLSLALFSSFCPLTSTRVFVAKKHESPQLGL